MKQRFYIIAIYSAIMWIASAACAQDIIVTNNAQKIEAKIIEVSKTAIKYLEQDNLNGPTFVLETKDLNSIIYSNGKIVLYNQRVEDTEKETQQKPTPLPNAEVIAEATNPIVEKASQPEPSMNFHNDKAKQQVELSNSPQKIVPNPDDVAKKDLSLARVICYSGVFVFTDCMPVEQYEILGEVYYDKNGKQHATTLYSYNPATRSMNTTGITYTESPQYPDIRDGLIVQSIMANRQVEGILITLTKEGEGRATLIKFKDGVKDKDIARVNTHLGLLVFTDCMPVNTYSFIGKINRAGGLNVDYNVLRDNLLKKVKNKYPTAQGIIPRFVSGGRDTAEAIRF